MRCSPEPTTLREQSAGAWTPPTVGTAATMIDNDRSEDKARCSAAEVSIDARDVLAGRYDHIPLRVIDA